MEKVSSLSRNVCKDNTMQIDYCYCNAELAIIIIQYFSTSADLPSRNTVGSR